MRLHTHQGFAHIQTNKQETDFELVRATAEEIKKIWGGAQEDFIVEIYEEAGDQHVEMHYTGNEIAENVRWMYNKAKKAAKAA